MYHYSYLGLLYIWWQILMFDLMIIDSYSVDFFVKYVVPIHVPSSLLFVTILQKLLYMDLSVYINWSLFISSGQFYWGFGLIVKTHCISNLISLRLECFFDNISIMKSLLSVHFNKCFPNFVMFSLYCR